MKDYLLGAALGLLTLQTLAMLAAFWKALIRSRKK
jgi:hypothetical protein